MNKNDCPICHKKKSTYYFKVQNTDYYQCQNCTLVFTRKLPRASYEEYELDHFVRLEYYLKNVFLKQVKAIKKYKASGRVLEIGIGRGFMMELLLEQGFQVEGIEPSASLVTQAKKLGLKVKKGYFEKIDLKNKKYDVVILNHVLEHVLDPNRFLSKLRKILNTEGVLFIQVPNFGSFESRIMKSRWPYLVPNDHYLQLTHQTLQLVLKQNKFEVLEARTTGAINELDNFPKELIRCLKSDQKRLVYYALQFVPSLIQEWFNQGSALWYIVR